MSRKSALVATFALLLTVVPAVALAQAPGNDDFEAATPVTAIPFEDAVEVGEATVEDGEPTETCAPFANTVWYALTLESADDVFIDTAGSNYDTALAVWVGSGFDEFDEAALIACNDDTFESLQAAVAVTAEAGVTYLVQVGAFAEAPPDAVLTISFGEAPKSKGKPFIEKFTFRGTVADAFVEEFDEETGTFAFAGVNIVDGRDQSKGSAPEQSQLVFVDWFEETFDEATETVTFTSWFGAAELEPEEYAISRTLQEAWVTKEMTLFGEMCTASEGELECTELGEVAVVVDVSWDGEGPVVRMRDRFGENFDGMRVRVFGRTQAREASTAGGVSGDIGFDLTGAFGRIARVADGFWSWNRGFGDGFFGFEGPGMALEANGLTMTTEVMSERFRGSFAQAFDEDADPETGEFSIRDVVLTQGRTKTKGAKWISMDELFVSSLSGVFDEVSQTVTLTEWAGSGPVAEGSVARNLSGAFAAAEITLFGTVCIEFYGEENGNGNGNGEEPQLDCTELGETTVIVEVTWEGVGPTATTWSRYDEMTASEHVRFSGRSTSREAIANGTVVGDDVGWVYTDGGGFMSRNADGFWFKG
jgi:hypothetical protein